MATKSYKILERRSVGSAALPKNDAREWIGHAVNARRLIGRALRAWASGSAQRAKGLLALADRLDPLPGVRA